MKPRVDVRFSRHPSRVEWCVHFTKATDKDAGAAAARAAALFSVRLTPEESADGTLGNVKCVIAPKHLVVDAPSSKQTAPKKPATSGLVSNAAVPTVEAELSARGPKEIVAEKRLFEQRVSAAIKIAAAVKIYVAALRARKTSAAFRIESVMRCHLARMELRRRRDQLAREMVDVVVKHAFHTARAEVESLRRWQKLSAVSMQVLRIKKAYVELFSLGLFF